METTDEFERRAVAAAGPAFLVGIGVVLLLVVGIASFIAAMPALVAWAMAGIGVTALLGGVLWGIFAGSAKRPRRV